MLAASATGGTGIAALIGAIGAGLPALVAWWRSTRVARQRADDSAWLRINSLLTQQALDLAAERVRCETAERALRRCANQYDRLLAVCDSNGLTVPPVLNAKPWEDGTGPTVKG